MCGILFTVDSDLSSDNDPGVDQSLLTCVSCRGPDSLRTHRILASSKYALTFTASVLHLRGSVVVPQPIISPVGNVLCWNGEIWSGLSVPLTESDTHVLSEALESAGEMVHKVFERIRGPYAFVYYQAATRKIWYGRDVLGRRSLLSTSQATSFHLCSVGRRKGKNWQEVSTNIMCLDLDTWSHKSYPWATTDPNHDSLARAYPSVNSELPASHSNPTNRLQARYLHAIEMLQTKLLHAIGIRIQSIPELDSPSSDSSRVAVMFSGGVDCAVIARLLHDVLPACQSIDLLNVSFENPRALANARRLDEAISTYDTPDRLTSLQTFEELSAACPSRDWRFIKIDIPYAEALAAKETVLDLMYPNDSVMDYSIALAFYFCARGQGTQMCGKAEEAQDRPYRTTAKVFFSGLGADEQLGGYSRHAAAYRAGGWSRLVSELQCDLDRIPSRNLGRDDRILSHFAREVRWPFLDEEVVSLLCTMPVDCKMTFDMPGGDKIILRDLASQLGLPKAAREKKRAVQFGSRSARMEIEHEKGDKIKGHAKQY